MHILTLRAVYKDVASGWKRDMGPSNPSSLRRYAMLWTAYECAMDVPVTGATPLPHGAAGVLKSAEVPKPGASGAGRLWMYPRGAKGMQNVFVGLIDTKDIRDWKFRGFDGRLLAERMDSWLDEEVPLKAFFPAQSRLCFCENAEDVRKPGVVESWQKEQISEDDAGRPDSAVGLLTSD
jgi:hypothetical protein